MITHEEARKTLVNITIKYSTDLDLLLSEYIDQCEQRINELET